jgi:hypothetical protein
VRQAVERGITPTTFRLAALEKRLGTDQEEFWQEATAILAASKQAMEIEEHVLRLAGMYPGLRDYGAAVKQLRRWIGRARGDRPKRSASRAPVATEFTPLNEDLTAAEIVVFGALHDSEYRQAAWMTVVRMPEVFETGKASTLASAIVTAFPEAPPEGPSSVWIHHVEPEENRQLLSDLLLEFRNSKRSEQMVYDTIRLLRDNAEMREMKKKLHGGLSAEQREELLSKLKKRHGDPRKERPPAAGDPFL